MMPLTRKLRNPVSVTSDEKTQCEMATCGYGVSSISDHFPGTHTTPDYCYISADNHAR